jgi:hypothetical protein
MRFQIECERFGSYTARKVRVEQKDLYFSLSVTRPGGVERQYRYHCESLPSVIPKCPLSALGPRCNLPVAYQNEQPPVKNAPYVYILSGSLSLIQGQVPEDAFDGEDFMVTE